MSAGAPAKFDKAEDLQASIDDYFEECKTGNVGHTITGLAYHLGFESRQSFYDYEKRDEFSYTIKRARLAIEMAYEQKLHGNSNTGAIFALKNFGWTDRQEVVAHNTNLNYNTEMTKEEIKQISEGLEKDV